MVKTLYYEPKGPPHFKVRFKSGALPNIIFGTQPTKGIPEV
jgi:hypothetical protein